MAANFDEQWERILQHSEPEIVRVAERASKEPVLRALFPYASLRNLRFSRATEYPYDPLPYIRPIIPGTAYELRDHDHRPIGRGDLDDVVGALVRLLIDHERA